MPQNTSQTQTIDRLIGLRLHQLQRTIGLPIVFGGATSQARSGRHLIISHARGTLGKTLLDLRVNAGRGLGGSAIKTGELTAVRDYATTPLITHDFDNVVVHEERISSIFAMPILINRVVGGVLYGALRGPQPIGDVVLDRARCFGASLEREITEMFTPAPDKALPPRRDARTSAALEELGVIARTATDPRFRAELTRIASELRATFTTDHIGSLPLATGAAESPTALAPREIEALELVAIGLSNSEVASAMGLKTETVRAYLRSAMRRLDVHNRTAAVHVAKRRGFLRGTAMPDW